MRFFNPPASAGVAVGSITGLAAGVAAWLAAPSSANLATALTDETGASNVAFGTGPLLNRPRFDGATTLTAAGTDQATALLIAQHINRFTTVASGTGARLQAFANNTPAWIINAGANALLLYPPVGAAINGGATNDPISIGVGEIWMSYNSSSTVYVAFRIQ